MLCLFRVLTWVSSSVDCLTGPDQPLRVMIEEPRQITASVGSTVRLVCIAVSYSSEVGITAVTFKLHHCSGNIIETASLQW